MAKSTNVKEEYIILLSPELDVEKYNKEREKLRSILEKEDFFLKSHSATIKDYTSTLKQQMKLKQEQARLATLESKAEREKERILEAQAKTKKRLVDLQISQTRKTDLEERIANRKRKEQEREEKSGRIDYRRFFQSLSSGNVAGMASSLGKASVYLGIAVGILSGIQKFVKSIYEQTTSLSNKMISADSAFVDKSVRQIMATFGVGSSTATGISSVLDLMGITPSDMATMTGGQMQLFAQLMAQWNAGIASIDSGKIQAYNEYVQGFQKFMASEKLDLQIEFYKMLVDNGDLLNSFFNSFGSLVSTFFDFLTSDLAESGLRTIIYAIDLLMQVGDIILKVVNILSPVLSLALEVLNIFLGGLSIVADFISEIFGMLLDVAEFIGIDTSTLRYFMDGIDDTVNSGKDVISDGGYLSSSTYYDSGNYGNITITQTTTNNFSGSDTSTYAVANSSAQSGQSWLSRQLADRLVR